jgi:DNA mismatch repair protein MutS2
MLVVSGPNAGGKTVVLKTAGLFSLLTQSGIPVPSGPGTRVPVFRAIRTEIGDAQAILADRSTFSSSVQTLTRILREARPETLSLIDEIGGATDPEEGSALASAWLEEYLARGGRAIVTTHLSAVKRFAADRADSVCAAMEFDERTGRPNYRLHPGLSGRSRALSAAREHGMPESVVGRAEAILGEAWKRRQEQETEAEQTIERLRESERQLLREREQVSQETHRLETERGRLVEERRRLVEEGLSRFENAQKALARQVAEEVAAMRKDSTRHASESPHAIVGAAAEEILHETGLASVREAAEAPPAALRVGGRARLRGGKIEGTIVALEENEAWIDVAGKRLRVLPRDLEPASPRVVARSSSPRVSAPASRETAGALTREINVIGRRLDEAIAEVEKSLDDALVAGAGRLRIVHGHGTGRLRDGLRSHFRGYPGVASLRSAEAREGGNGATIVELE